MTGVVGREAGQPDDLVLTYTCRQRPASTQGRRSSPRAPSRRPATRRCYPPGIPIGDVTERRRPGAGHPAGPRRGRSPTCAASTSSQVLTKPNADGAAVSARRVQLVAASRRCSRSSPCIVQVAAVSQIPSSAPTPTSRRCVVAAVGLLCGSVPARCFGFAVGLFLDTGARADHRAVLAACYWASATGAGRAARAARPAGRARPDRGRRRRRPRSSTIGYSLVQFLLGRRRAGQLAARPADPRHDHPQRALATPVYALVRRWLCPVLPEDPRRRRRRAYTTGGLSPLAAGVMSRLDPAPPRTAARRSRRSSRCASPSSASSRFALFAIIFFRLWYLQVLAGDQYLAEAHDNRVAHAAHPAPRGDIVDRNGRRSSRTALANVVQLDPREAAARPSATPPRRGASRSRARAPPAPHHAASKREPEAARPPPPGCAALTGACAGRSGSMSPKTIQERVIRSLAAVPYARGDAADRRPAPVLDFLVERKDAVPRRRLGPVYLRRYPAARRWPPSCWGRSARSTPASSRRSASGRHQGTVVGKGGIEYAYDRYLRGRDGVARVQVDALGQPQGELRGREPRCRAAAASCRSTSGCRGRAEALALGDRNARHPARPARSSRWTRATARCSRWGPTPTSTRRSSREPITQAALRRSLLGDRAARRCSTARSPAPTRRARRSSRSPRWPALASGVITPGTVDQRQRLHPVGSPAAYCNAGTSALRHDRPAQRDRAVSSDVYFYTLGQGLNPPRASPSSVARDARLRPHDRGRPPRRVRRPRPRPRAGARALADAERVPPQASTSRSACRPRRPPGAAASPTCARGRRRQREPRRRPGRPAGHAAADGGRLLDDRERRARRAPAPRAGGRGRRRPAAAAHRAAARRATSEIDRRPAQAILDGLQRGDESGGTSADVFKGWPQNRYPVFGKTGTAQSADRPTTSRGTSSLRPRPGQPDRRSPSRSRSGGFGADAAAPAARDDPRRSGSTKRVKFNAVAGTSRRR